MQKKVLILSLCIALLSMGCYAYLKSKTKEDPEPGEVGDEGADYPMENAVLKTNNFKLSEFACHDGTPVPPEYYGNVSTLMHNLQLLRNRIGRPIFISSGYRTQSWNAKQPAASPISQHLTAKAADIKVVGMSPAEVKNVIEMLIADGIMEQGGVGLYPTFVHYDVRGKRARW